MIIIGVLFLSVSSFGQISILGTSNYTKTKIGSVVEDYAYGSSYGPGNIILFQVVNTENDTSYELKYQNAQYTKISDFHTLTIAKTSTLIQLYPLMVGMFSNENIQKVRNKQDVTMILTIDGKKIMFNLVSLLFGTKYLAITNEDGSYLILKKGQVDKLFGINQENENGNNESLLGSIFKNK